MAADPREFDIPSHEIIIASSKNERQQCFDVRVEVFHHEQKFLLDVEFDDKEDISTHFLLRLTPSLKPIGTIRGYLVPGTTDTYKLTRLAVLKDYRKYGFGRKLVEALHIWVKAHASGTAALVSPSAATANSNGDYKMNGSNIVSNPDSTADSTNANQTYPTPPPHQDSKWIKIHCHSQIYAKGFYSKFGYIPEGEEFLEDGDPHQKMVLRIRIPTPSTMISNFV